MRLKTEQFRQIYPLTPVLIGIPWGVTGLTQSGEVNSTHTRGCVDSRCCIVTSSAGGVNEE